MAAFGSFFSINRPGGAEHAVLVRLCARNEKEDMRTKRWRRRRRRNEEPHFPHRASGLELAASLSQPQPRPRPLQQQKKNSQVHHQALPDALAHGRRPGRHQRRAGKYERGRLALARLRHDQGERLARGEFRVFFSFFETEDERKKRVQRERKKGFFAPAVPLRSKEKQEERFLRSRCFAPLERKTRGGGSFAPAVSLRFRGKLTPFPSLSLSLSSSLSVSLPSSLSLSIHLHLFSPLSTGPGRDPVHVPRGARRSHRARELRPALLAHRRGQDLPARVRRPVARLRQGRPGLPLRGRGGPHGPRDAAHAVRAGHAARLPVLRRVLRAGPGHGRGERGVQGRDRAVPRGR